MRFIDLPPSSPSLHVALSSHSSPLLQSFPSLLTSLTCLHHCPTRPPGYHCLRLTFFISPMSDVTLSCYSPPSMPSLSSPLHPHLPCLILATATLFGFLVDCCCFVYRWQQRQQKVVVFTIVASSSSFVKSSLPPSSCSSPPPLPPSLAQPTPYCLREGCGRWLFFKAVEGQQRDARKIIK